MTAAAAPDLAPASSILVPVSVSARPDVSLASLAPGHTARVVGIDGSCPEGDRLLDLGFIPGTPVEILKRAPLGDPVVYGLRGYRICLRASEANLIRVKTE
jgi:ferrous iron transport protein A